MLYIISIAAVHARSFDRVSLQKKWPSKFALKYLKYLYSIGHNLILYSQKKLIQKSDLQKLAYVSNIDSDVCLFLLPADPLKEFNSQIVDLKKVALKISFCHLTSWPLEIFPPKHFSIQPRMDITHRKGFQWQTSWNSPWQKESESTPRFVGYFFTIRATRSAQGRLTYESPCRWPL